MIEVADIIRLLKGKRFLLNDEKALQADIYKMLSATFPQTSIQPEYDLDLENIIDFLIDRDIGIEVKIKGAKRALYRQCVRYCEFDQVKSFILITSLSMGFPQQINGKDCYVLNLSTAWL